VIPVCVSFVHRIRLKWVMISTVIMFLDIIHRHVFCLKCHPVYISKNNVSEAGFYHCPQVKPTLLGPIDRASPHLPSSQTFSSYLRNQYGPGIYPKFRKLERLKMQLAKTSNHLTFLMKCKTQRYCPQRPLIESSIAQSSLF
jgi:hypothetical protein